MNSLQVTFSCSSTKTNWWRYPHEHAYLTRSRRARHHHGSHGHGKHGHGHSHTHGVIDASISTSDRGIWAIKWSFIGLFITALFQIVVVYLSKSVVILADTIHNFGDAATAIPLWVAFALARWKPSKRFTYGYGRVEALAGVAIVLTITFSAVVAGYETIRRFLHPQPVGYLWAVMVASIIGFIGNEAVAIFRIKVGKEIQSAALIADGYHARIDGWTSLAVLFGASGVWLGYPLADPIVGLLITIAIVRIVWQSIKAVFTRMLDGVEPEVIDEIRHAVKHVEAVKRVTDVRARWLGHRLHAELNVAVASELSVAEAHDVAKEVRHQLMHHLLYLSSVVVHVDPIEEAGEEFHPHHRTQPRSLAAHSH